MVSTHDVAWASGLFEGEGCISFHKIKNRRNSFRFSLSLQMSDEDVVRRFSEVVETGSFLGPYEGQVEGHKQRWLWQVQNKNGCHKVLQLFLPYLGLRRKSKAQEMLDKIQERSLQ